MPADMEFGRSEAKTRPVVLYRLRATISLATEENSYTQLPLTRSVFGGSSDSLPILCGSHRYNMSSLMLKPYDKQVEIMFDRVRIVRYLVAPENEDTGKQSKADENNILSHNFTNMLALLFPTSIPTMNGVHLSSQVMTMPVVPAWFARHTHYSYLTVRGHKYTVTGTTWINDVGNNPRYAELVRACRVFVSWRQKLVDPANRAQTHDEFVNFENIVRRAIASNAVTFEPIHTQTPDVNATEFSNAIAVIREYFDMDVTSSSLASALAPQAPTVKPDSAIAQLLNAWKTLKNTNTQIEKQMVRSESDKAILYAIVKLKKYMGMYELVDRQEMAIVNISKVNMRYADNPDMAAYIPTKYPQFIAFVSTIAAFHGKYIPGNPVWAQMITSLIQTTVPGMDVLSRILDIADRLDTEASCVYFDEDKSTAHGNKDSGRDPRNENADLNAVVAELQMDLIDGTVTADNVGTVTCAFKDHLLGLSYNRLSIPVAARWRLPAPSYFSAVRLLAGVESNTSGKKTETETQGQNRGANILAKAVPKKQGGAKSMRHSRMMVVHTTRRRGLGY